MRVIVDMYCYFFVVWFLFLLLNFNFVIVGVFNVDNNLLGFNFLLCVIL